MIILVFRVHILIPHKTDVQGELVERLFLVVCRKFVDCLGTCSNLHIATTQSKPKWSKIIIIKIKIPNPKVFQSSTPHKIIYRDQTLGITKSNLTKQ